MHSGLFNYCQVSKEVYMHFCRLMSEKDWSFKIKLGSTNQFFSETQIESHGLKKRVDSHCDQNLRRLKSVKMMWCYQHNLNIFNFSKLHFNFLLFIFEIFPNSVLKELNKPYNKKLQMVTSNMLYNSITYKIQCFTEEPHHSEVQFEKVGLWVVSA